MVVRLDRLARSLSHLLQVIETLEAKGAHFRSLGDPIDTTTAQGKFSCLAECRQAGGAGRPPLTQAGISDQAAVAGSICGTPPCARYQRSSA